LASAIDWLNVRPSNPVIRASGLACVGTRDNGDVRIMASFTAALRNEADHQPAPTTLGTLVLARIVAEQSGGKAELQRDLAPLLSPRLVQAEARHAIERTLAALVIADHVREDRGRFMPTEDGARALAAELGLRVLPAKLDWTTARDVWLIAKALGLGTVPAARLRRIAKPDGLRNAIVQQAYGLAVRPDMAPAKLRAQLAVIALERAFGNKVKSAFGSGGLSAKAGRLLAGQLAATPRDFGTDSRLVAALAAEHAGARAADAEALRLALLRRWLGQGLEREAASAVPELPALQPPPLVAANDAATARPDLAQFASDVLIEARAVAEGWPGNRKAFISRVWQAIHASRAHWRLTEIEFKCMLAEAHRAGLIVLANADLKDKRTVREVQESAVAYKNTVWHQIRVEEA
jgi:hypothetical protein